MFRLMLALLVVLTAGALLVGGHFVLAEKKKAAEAVEGVEEEEAADKDKGDSSGKFIVELSLPDSASPPSWGPEQVSKLTIDGKDYSTPRLTRRTITVTPKKGADTVKIVYTFWSNTYTRFIRTKVVEVEKGKTVKVDFNKPDKKYHDEIYVIFVPTPHEVVEAMCKMAKVTKDDVVYDIGCGDGRLVIHAVKKHGAKKGVGIDLDPQRIKESTANAKKEKVTDKVVFQEKDALKIKDFSDATVIFMYLTDPLCEALAPTFKKTLKPGTRIVSHRFRMGKWEPDRTDTITAKNNRGDDEEYELHIWTIKKPEKKEKEKEKKEKEKKQNKTDDKVRYL